MRLWLLLVLAVVVSPLPVYAAAVHSPNPSAVIAPVILAQLPEISPLRSPAGLTVALVLPTNAAGVVGRAAVGFFEECEKTTLTNNLANTPNTDSDTLTDKKTITKTGRVAFTLYATDGTPQMVMDAYRAAVDDGVGVVVGPLLRGNVVALTSAVVDAPVPTLLLQPVDADVGDNYYFLTAEAGREAAEVAELVYGANAPPVVIVSQGSELARRQLQGFAGKWRRLAGGVPSIFRPHDYEDDKGWNVLFERYKDAAEAGERMVVFAAGDAAFVRRVRHFVPSYHPVFGGSFSYDGAAFADDIYIMAMPQLLAPPVDDSVAVVRKLRALGGDACYVALREWVEGWGYHGRSGDVFLDGREFRRRGVLARLHSGKLQKAPPLLPLFEQE